MTKADALRELENMAVDYEDKTEGEVADLDKAIDIAIKCVEKMSESDDLFMEETKVTLGDIIRPFVLYQYAIVVATAEDCWNTALYIEDGIVKQYEWRGEYYNSNIEVVGHQENLLKDLVLRI